MLDSTSEQENSTMQSEKRALLSTASFRALAITGAALASLTFLGTAESVAGNRPASAQPAVSANHSNPCAAANPRVAANPCAAANLRAAQTVARGSFYHANGHKARGNAHISKGPDGTYRLKFTQFASDWGPDINIILSPAHAPTTSSAVKQAGYITIAPRKARKGDQSYRLPKDFDPSLYQSVGIWCESFGVLFGAAQLQGL